VRWLTGHLMVVVVCCVGPHSRGSVEVGSGELLIGCRIENFPILLNVISHFSSSSYYSPLLDCNYFGDSRDLEAIRHGMHTARKLVQDAAAEPGFWAIELLPRFLLNYDWTFNLFKDVCTAPYFHACGTCGMQAREAASTVTERTIWGQVNHSLHYICTYTALHFSISVSRRDIECRYQTTYGVYTFLLA
jgi:hypothetical protein